MAVILASQSPRRRELLGQMGFTDFIIRPAQGEEIVDPALSPDKLVEELSRQKCAEVAALSDPDAQNVIRLIEQFPELIVEALNRSEPSMITRFSVDLAQAYNKFYYENRIIDAPPAVRAARVNLTKAAKSTITIALDLIGIAAPERM